MIYHEKKIWQAVGTSSRCEILNTGQLFRISHRELAGFSCHGN